MITYTTSNNEKMQQLYKKANKRLKALGVTDDDGNAVEVDTIQEYFAHLRHIIYGPSSNELKWGEVKYGEDEDEVYTLENGMIFLRMPIGDDEPPIFIDANTRTISKKINGNGAEHPFFKNGISVQGDEVAEIVFFEIHRYFDATDLSEMNIVIQWAHANEPNDIYITPAFIKDIEDEPGKLIFGWPIGSEITQYPGNIIFSIRFFRTDTDGTMLYSFNTKNQTVSINSALTVEEITNEDSVDENQVFLIVGRVMNSSYGGIENPAVPVYEYFLPAQDQDFGDITDVITLFGSGSKTGQGKLAYQWIRTLFGDSKAYNEENVRYQEINGYIPDIINYYYKNENDPAYGFVTLVSQEAYNSFVKENPFSKIYIQYEILESFTEPDFYQSIDSFISDQIPYYYKTTPESDYVMTMISKAEDFKGLLDLYKNIYIHGSSLILTPEIVRPGKIYLDIKNQINAKEITIFRDIKNFQKLSNYYTIAGPKIPVISTNLNNNEILTNQLKVILDENSLNENIQYYWECRNNLNSSIYDSPIEGIRNGNEFNLTPSKEGFYHFNIVNIKNKGQYPLQSNECFVYEPYVDNEKVEYEVSLNNEGNNYSIIIDFIDRESNYDVLYCSSQNIFEN